MATAAIIIVVVALVLYVSYVIYRNAPLPKLNADGTRSPYYDAFGNHTVTGYWNWLGDGMPMLKQGFREALKNEWWWIILVILVYLLYKLNRSK